MIEVGKKYRIRPTEKNAELEDGIYIIAAINSSHTAFGIHGDYRYGKNDDSHPYIIKYYTFTKLVEAK